LRKSRCIKLGIPSQYQFLLERFQHLRVPPTWPEDGPWIHELSLCEKSLVESMMQGRYGRVFEPETAWQFCASEHLRDAQVGVAIWQR
jgi:hypothetical protein